jgi:FkbM family methyltransferase
VPLAYFKKAELSGGRLSAEYTFGGSEKKGGMSVKLRDLFKRRRRPDRSGSELAKIFRTVYGKDPNEREKTALTNLRRQPETEASGFRHVIGYFDHQFRHTPFSVRFAPADLSPMNVPEGFTLILDTADGSVSDYLLSRGDYEPHLVSFLKERIKPEMVVIDVGANIGFHTMLAARLVGAAGKVICIEPNSENCRLILLSANENQFGQVVIYPVAASDFQGYALFTTHIGSNGGLLRSTKKTLLDPSCVVVPTIRLDDIIKEKVDLIKIDTEGAEGLVVGGAKSLIEQQRPIVVSEFSKEMLQQVSGMSGTEYLTYFRSIGYNLHLINRQGGALHPILDVDLFLDNYKPAWRIEDLAFIPN